MQHTLKNDLNTQELNEGVRREVLANARACVPDLIDILADENQWGADEDADGRAAINAAYLLGDLKATDAIEPMLDVLGEVEMDGELATMVVDALCNIGPAVMEPVLRRNHSSEGMEVQFGYVEILARCGAKDERIFDVLCRELDSDPAFGAAVLGLYGDTEALGRLDRALNGVRLKPGKEEGLRAVDVMELCVAIEKLGGKLTEEQAAKQVAATAILEALPEEDEDFEESDTNDKSTPVSVEPFAFKSKSADTGHVHSASCGHAHQEPHKRTREKIGPNEPCHCGSGKKYKKCHLFEDERARFAQ